jgi:hypothetical protein
MAEWFTTRVPLNPEDAAVNRKIQDNLEANANLPFQSEMARLGAIAQGKRYAERGGGPIDQEQTLRAGMKYADAIGAHGGTPEMENGLRFLASMASQPDSRNVYLQASLIPEHAIMHATEALSGEKSLAERGKRLAMAIPAAVVPGIGYPIGPAYDRMYESLGPVAGTAVDFMLPDLGNANTAMRGGAKAASGLMDTMRYGGGIPTSLIDNHGNLIRQLMSTPR